MSLLIEFPTSLSISLGDGDSGVPGGYQDISGGVVVSEFCNTDLLTEFPIHPVSLEGGDSLRLIGSGASDGVAVLEIPVEWNDFCYACERRCLFVALTRCAEGLVSECAGCGDVRVPPDSRMNSEVA